MSPAELADRNVVHFKRMVEALNCTNDFFIRTTDSEHEAGVQRFMQGLYDRGEIYEGTYEGWYCPNCADFKTEQEILDGNLCPIHRIPLEWVKEDNYFFKLSAYQERLERLYADRPGLRRCRASATTRRCRSSPAGLQDVSVSRPNWNGE